MSYIQMSNIHIDHQISAKFDTYKCQMYTLVSHPSTVKKVYDHATPSQAKGASAEPKSHGSGGQQGPT